MSREAMKQALEFLSHDMVAEDWPHQKRKDAVCDALRAALAEPEQEPVASLMTNIKLGDQKVVWNDDGFDRALWHETPLYTAPTPRKPLTDDEIALIVAECSASAHRHDDFSFARAIERAHGIGGGE